LTTHDFILWPLRNNKDGNRRVTSEAGGPTPASEPGEIADATRHTGHRGTGVALSGHNRRCTAAGSRRSPSGGYPVLAKLGGLSRYVDPVQAGDIFTQDLAFDLQGQIHVVLLFQILRQPV
jgi:hypothetical protein